MKNKVDPHLSAMCPGDLGLKAAFWNSKKEGPLTFLPIVGWVVVTNYVESAKIPFAAVVIYQNAPTLVGDSTFPDFAGYFPIITGEAEARDVISRSGIKVPLLAKGRAVE